MPIRKEYGYDNPTGEYIQDHVSPFKKTLNILVKISLRLRLSVIIKQGVVWLAVRYISRQTMMYSHLNCCPVVSDCTTMVR
jgi:hypothetical protein